MVFSEAQLSINASVLHDQAPHTGVSMLRDQLHHILPGWKLTRIKRMLAC